MLQAGCVIDCGGREATCASAQPACTWQDRQQHAAAGAFGSPAHLASSLALHLRGGGVHPSPSKALEPAQPTAIAGFRRGQTAFQAADRSALREQSENAAGKTHGAGLMGAQRRAECDGDGTRRRSAVWGGSWWLKRRARQDGWPRGGGDGNLESRRHPSAPPRVTSAAASPRQELDRRRSDTHAAHSVGLPPYPDRAIGAEDDARSAVRRDLDRDEARCGERPNYVGLGLSESFRAHHSDACAVRAPVGARGGRDSGAERGAGAQHAVSDARDGWGVRATAAWRGSSLRADGSDRWRLRVAPPVDGEGHISPDVKVIDRFQIVQLLDRGTFGTVFRAW